MMMLKTRACNDKGNTTWRELATAAACAFKRSTSSNDRPKQWIIKSRSWAPRHYRVEGLEHCSSSFGESWISCTSLISGANDISGSMVAWNAQTLSAPSGPYCAILFNVLQCDALPSCRKRCKLTVTRVRSKCDHDNGNEAPTFFAILVILI